MKVFRARSELNRVGLTWEERWGSTELGLITSWERGREKSLEDPQLAQQARDGQLMVLPWKGGVEKELKTTKKYGVFNYLAMWQGLRGDDLNLDPDVEISITCSVHNVPVTFTSDYARYANSIG